MANPNETRKQQSKQPDTKPATTVLTAPDTGPKEIVEYESYGEDAGGGFEHQTPRDRKMPYLEILDKGSPAVTKGDNPEARMGNLRNTVSGKIYDGKVGVVITPAVTDFKVVAWIDRKAENAPSGVGFRGQYDPGDKIVRDSQRANREAGGKFNRVPMLKASEPILLQDTFYMPVVIHDPDDGLIPVMMAFKSTQIKPYQLLQSALADVKVNVRDPDGKGYHKETPPLYSHRVRLTTERQDRDNGKYVWYTPSFKPADGDKYVPMRPTEPAFQAAKELRNLYNAGAANVDYAAQGEASDDEGSGYKREDESDLPI